MQVDLVEISLRMVVSLSAARGREARGILFRILSANLKLNAMLFTRKQRCNGEYTKHCTRSKHQLKMAAPADVSKKRSNFQIRQF